MICRRSRRDGPARPPDSATARDRRGVPDSANRSAVGGRSPTGPSCASAAKRAAAPPSTPPSAGAGSFAGCRSTDAPCTAFRSAASAPVPPRSARAAGSAASSGSHPMAAAPAQAGPCGRPPAPGNCAWDSSAFPCSLQEIPLVHQLPDLLVELRIGASSACRFAPARTVPSALHWPRAFTGSSASDAPRDRPRLLARPVSARGLLRHSCLEGRAESPSPPIVDSSQTRPSPPWIAV